MPEFFKFSGLLWCCTLENIFWVSNFYSYVSGSTKDWNGLSITSRNGDDIRKISFLNLKNTTHILHLKDFFDILTKKKSITRKNSFRPNVCSYIYHYNYYYHQHRVQNSTCLKKKYKMCINIKKNTLFWLISSEIW